jgi:CRISPR-associated protein Cas1
MRELLNVLYVMTQGSVLHVEHDTLRVEVDGETRFRAPLMRLSGVVVFGRVTLTPYLIQRCAEDGRSLVWLDAHGRFRARVEGQTRGNVLLRRAQHLVLSDSEQTSRLAREFVAGKIQNSRQLILRAARDASLPADRAALSAVSDRLVSSLERLRQADDLGQVLGCEGDAGRAYFSALRVIVRADPSIAMAGRTRRPPRDPANALLSFLYALLRSECSAALEGVGLDPQVGYLHCLRPGRPALALDLMEELRPVVADRLALNLLNRRQLRAEHFDVQPGGATYLSEEGRRLVLIAYQKRKEEEIKHRALRQTLPLGLVPHVQARLLARHLRGDLDVYLPYLYR